MLSEAEDGLPQGLPSQTSILRTSAPESNAACSAASDKGLLEPSDKTSQAFWLPTASSFSLTTSRVHSSIRKRKNCPSAALILRTTMAPVSWTKCELGITCCLHETRHVEDGRISRRERACLLYFHAEIPTMTSGVRLVCRLGDVWTLQASSCTTGHRPLPLCSVLLEHYSHRSWTSLFE